MINQYNSMRPRLLFFVIFFIFSAIPLAVNADNGGDQKSIAFLPLKINAAKDLTYLNNGIRDMLASRLAASVGANVINKARVDAAMDGQSTPESSLKALAEKINAAYLVTGSITSLGKSLSLDAKVYDADRGKFFVNIFATAPSEDEVIPAVDKMAWDIAEKVYGYESPQKKQAVASQQAVPVVQNPVQTAHPERAFLRPSATGYGGTSIIRPQSIAGGYNFTKSQNFSLAIQGMDVGDVDGDGVSEVVIAGRQEVRVYKTAEDGSRLTLFWTIPTIASYRNHYVSLADLNNDDTDEIYVSVAEESRNNNIGQPRSFGVEWRQDNFYYLFKDVPWYVRAMEIQGLGETLIGQRAEANAPFMPGVYLVESKDGEIVQGEMLSLPTYLNIFDFTYADLEGDGNPEIVAINQSDRILVLRQSGDVLWISDDHYGGSIRYVGEDYNLENPHSDDEVIGMEGGQERIYIPARIIVADINNDGKKDIVINKNLSTSSRLLQNLKTYPSGEIHGLTWNGLALNELWRTRKIDGYIADYQLDVDPKKNTGVLHVGVMIRGRGFNFLTSKSSTVLTYHLDFSGVKDEPQDDE